MPRPGPVLALIALVSCSFAGTALAADEGEYAPAVEAHRAGRWSMQFQLGDNFRLGSFEGTGISVTKNRSESSAWRLGLSYAGSATRLTGDTAFSSGTPPFIPEPETKDHRLSIGADLLKLHRYEPGHRIGLFLGLGPSVSFSRQSFHAVEGDTVGTRTSDQRVTNAFFGVVGQLGTEVLITRGISLHAHYGGRFGYSRATQTSEITQLIFGVETYFSERTVRARTWSIRDDGVTVGISVYL